MELNRCNFGRLDEEVTAMWEKPESLCKGEEKMS